MHQHYLLWVTTCSKSTINSWLLTLNRVKQNVQKTFSRSVEKKLEIRGYTSRDILQYIWVFSNNCYRIENNPGLDVRKIPRVTIACLHEAYYFWRGLAMTIYWRMIVYAGVWACASLEFCVSTSPFCTATHWPIFFLLFVCDTNTSYVVTFAIENIRTKAHQCSQTCGNYGV